MNHEELRKQVQQGINRQCASLTSDPYRVQRVMNMAHEQERKGGYTVRKKMPLAVILVICLTLISSVALAAVLVNAHIEKAMDITKDKGAFTEWTLEDKLALIEAMQDEGINLPDDKLAIIEQAVTDEERENAATELLVGIYGNEEHISHFTIASHDWGDPFLWTLEQKAWFWETLRAKGLYTGSTKYILPTEEDLSREQVVNLAKRAIQEAFDLSNDIMDSYDADVTFFTIEGTDAEPRWRVCLGDAYAEAAEFEVLLTRDGQVTEDASLYIFKPEDIAAQSREISPVSSVQKPYEKRLLATEILYLSAGNMQYHFLPDCPSVQESLTAATNIGGYQPCPYCVLQTQLWSAEDKILYGVMVGEFPDENVIPASNAERIAMDFLVVHGAADVEVLVPYSRYLSDLCHYTIFFARLENGQIDPIYAVIVDAMTGEVLSDFDPAANGHG